MKDPVLVLNVYVDHKYYTTLPSRESNIVSMILLGSLTLNQDVGIR